MRTILLGKILNPLKNPSYDPVTIVFSSILIYINLIVTIASTEPGCP